MSSAAPPDFSGRALHVLANSHFPAPQILRTDVSKYGESDDRSEISNFFFYEKNLFNAQFENGIKRLDFLLRFSIFDKWKISLLSPRVLSWNFNFGLFRPFLTRSLIGTFHVLL